MKNLKKNPVILTIIDGVFFVASFILMFYLSSIDYVHTLVGFCIAIVMTVSGVLFIIDCNKIDYTKKSRQKEREERGIIR